MILTLLPDSHEMLRREMPAWDFDDEPMASSLLCESLVETMRHNEGIGLAANQVGIEARVFAMETDDGPIVAFNPMVVWVSNETVKMREGCLSFPSLELTLSRPKEIEVSYYEPSGARVVKSFSGLAARCALHEIDHLEGVVFTEKVSRLKLQMAMKKIKKHKNRP